MTGLRLSAILALVSAAGLVALCDGFTASSTPPDKMLPSVSLHRSGSRQKRAALVMDQPIRIMPYYADNLDAELGSKASLVRNTIIPDLLTFLQNSLSVAPVTEPIRINHQCDNQGRFFKVDGDVYCAFQCEPVTRCGPFTVPAEHLTRCRQCNDGSFNRARCQNGTPSTDGAGVTGHDFLLYVSADQSACPSTSPGGAQVVAFASACQHEDMQDRPVAGVVNFCPDGLQNRDEQFSFALTKHEVLHALVIARGLFALWRDENNNPRTTRESSGLPPLDSMNNYIISSSTIASVTYSDWLTTSGVRSHTVTKLITPAIQRETRAHFACNSLDGVELENQGGTGTAFNHFEKRLLGNEAMTGQFTFNPVFSRFTFAALEDSGWYSVNYSLAEPLLWGRGAGCRFAQGSCREWIQARNTGNLLPTPFCDQLFSSSRLGCTVDREAVSKCNLATFQDNLQEQFQFYSSPNIGGQVQIADFCGIQDVFRIADGSRVRETTCSVASNAPSSNTLLESYGLGSRCVNHGRQWTRDGRFITSYGSGCYQYSCSGNEVTITIEGEAIQCGCSQANQERTFTRTVNGELLTGSILCPSCDVICEESAKVIISPGDGSTDTGGGSGGGGGGTGASTRTTAALWSVNLAVLAGLILH